LLFGWTAIAQTPAELKVDAASVRPASVGFLDQRLQIDASDFSVRAIPLTNLIRQAFDVNQYQVSGGPAWMEKNLWAIRASIVGPSDHTQVMEMLRNLLIDRFHLKTHIETRQTKVYELTVAKGGLKAGGKEGLLGWRTDSRTGDVAERNQRAGRRWLARCRSHRTFRSIQSSAAS
jgi:uncharacterized protein (TIGR03435 family)